MQIVRRGTWLYDGSVPAPVDVVSLAHDFWRELAETDDLADPDMDPDAEPRELGEGGVLFYYRFAHAGRPEVWPDSGAYPTIRAAMAAAERRLGAAITWL